MAAKRRRSEESPGGRARSPRRTSGPDVPPGPPEDFPDPEVAGKPKRRQYPAEYKLRILKEVDACTEAGEVGAILRREGLYSSLLSTWRRQREEGSLKGLGPAKRGRKAKPPNPLAPRVEELEREKRRLEVELKQARAVIDVQKKLSDVLCPPPAPGPEGEDGRT